MKKQIKEKKKQEGEVNSRTTTKTDFALFSIVIIVLGLMIYFKLNYTPATVHGPSMQPTYQEGDCLAIKDAKDPVTESYERGDVVVFNLNLFGGLTESVVVKRVLGVAGDTIEIIPKAVEGTDQLQEEIFVNGEIVVKEPISRYVDAKKTNPRILEVPEGHLFVVGDNRAESFDSRFFPKIFVSKEDVIGKITGYLPKLLCR